MENSVIEFIFSPDGEMHAIVERTQEYIKLSKESAGLYDKICESLEGELLEDFKNFAELTMHSEAAACRAHFRTGVKYGVRIMAECFSD